MPYFRRRRKRVLTLVDAWGSLNGMGHYNVDGSDGTVTILQAPEFISDTDRDVDTKTRPFDINADAYTGYIKPNAYSGAFIETVTSIDSAHNRDVTYSIVGGNEAGLFWIEASTGKIRTAVHLYEEENLLAAYNLQIKVKDNENDQYDLASVNITISQWNVSRNGNYNAPAVSTVGCTISELAEEIGLDAASFQQWLTFTNDNVTLHDGTQVHKDSVTADMILGANSFQIPNVIVSAWFGDNYPTSRNKWQADNDKLAALGFLVARHDNDVFGIDPNAINQAENMQTMLENDRWTKQSKHHFENTIKQASRQKFLHGLLIMGHGGNDGAEPDRFGTAGAYESVANGGNGNTVTGPPVRPIYYNDVSGWIEYRLGAVLVFTCDGTGDSEALVSSSPTRVYWAKDGLSYVDDYPQDIHNLWIGQKQHTKKQEENQ